MGEAARHG
jgi:hemerythrin-like domain-containing protein